MLSFLHISDTLVFLFSYMFIYNLSLYIIFGVFYYFIFTNTKTIFSFKDLKLNLFFVSLLTITLFSIAGVPPFIGFFSKLFILLVILNTNFFLFFLFFFILLFFALYFYLQNIRFLLTTQNTKLAYTFETGSVRIPTLPIYIFLMILFFLLFGFAFIDDVLLYFQWLLL